jgi:hypothetical protein
MLQRGSLILRYGLRPHVANKLSKRVQEVLGELEVIVPRSTRLVAPVATSNLEAILGKAYFRAFKQASLSVCVTHV